MQENGLIDLEALKAAIRPDTILISVMYVNNEIGVIQDIPTIGALCREKGIIFHVDAAPATGKIDIDLTQLPVDLMSLASHKTYGPRALARCTCAVSPVSAWKRKCTAAATSAVCVPAPAHHQIVGMGEAFRIARKKWAFGKRAHSHCNSAC